MCGRHEQNILKLRLYLEFRWSGRIFFAKLGIRCKHSRNVFPPVRYCLVALLCRFSNLPLDNPKNPGLVEVWPEYRAVVWFFSMNFQQVAVEKIEPQSLLLHRTCADNAAFHLLFFGLLGGLGGQIFTMHLRSSCSFLPAALGSAWPGRSCNTGQVGNRLVYDFPVTKTCNAMVQ